MIDNIKIFVYTISSRQRGQGRNSGTFAFLLAGNEKMLFPAQRGVLHK